MRKVLALVSFLYLFFGAAFAQAAAAVPTEISDMTDNASAVFTTVKGIVVGIIGFLILVTIVKLVKKR